MIYSDWNTGENIYIEKMESGRCNIICDIGSDTKTRVILDTFYSKTTSRKQISLKEKALQKPTVRKVMNLT